jgi:hypothetical protein
MGKGTEVPSAPPAIDLAKQEKRRLKKLKKEAMRATAEGSAPDSTSLCCNLATFQLYSN